MDSTCQQSRRLPLDLLCYEPIRCASALRDHHARQRYFQMVSRTWASAEAAFVELPDPPGERRDVAAGAPRCRREFNPPNEVCGLDPGFRGNAACQADPGRPRAEAQASCRAFLSHGFSFRAEFLDRLVFVSHGAKVTTDDGRPTA